MRQGKSPPTLVTRPSGSLSQIPKGSDPEGRVKKRAGKPVLPSSTTKKIKNGVDLFPA
jgi:hypothetical protein